MEVVTVCEEEEESSCKHDTNIEKIVSWWSVDKRNEEKPKVKSMA